MSKWARQRLRAARKWLSSATGVDIAPERWITRRRNALTARYERGGSAIERFLVRRYIGLRTRLGSQYVARRFAVVQGGHNRERRIGVYLKGACDLSSVFATVPQIRTALDGTCCVMRPIGEMAACRSDILLQALSSPSPEVAAMLSDRLNLLPGYFEPRLFEPRFRVPGFGEFPKSVVILSIAPDVVRTAYRHRESGLLVDPGGIWLEHSIDRVLSNLSTVEWFRKNFEKVGKLGLDDSRANVRRIVTKLQGELGATVIYFNTLSVETGSTTHTYQLVEQPMAARIREFNLALVELSRELGFSIVDLDRILKREGIQGQIDFAHFTPDRIQVIADEVFRILVAAGVFPGGASAPSRTATAG